MLNMDGKDPLRKAHVKQDVGASGTNAALTKGWKPSTPYTPLGTEPVGTMPKYTPGKDTAAEILPNTAWTDIPVEDYSPYLEQMHQAKQQAAVAGLEAAYQQNMAVIDSSKERTAQEYQAARNQTAGASEQARRNFNQYAAANGLNSGTGGQAELARSVALQGSLGAINAQEANAMADLELKRAEAESEYNAAIAQARYTGEYELAAALYEEKVRVQEALTEQAIHRQKNELEQYQLRYQAQRDAVEDRRYEYEQELEGYKYQNELALQQAAQALDEKEQADAVELEWQKFSQSLTAQQEKQLAEYGEMYMKAGVLPTESMCRAMGIPPVVARRYILLTQKSE